MDVSLRIALEQISVVATRDGLVKPHVLVVTRLFTSTSIVQLGPRHLILNLIKARQMLSISKVRWTRHERRNMLRVHQMEKGSLHPMGQVVTPHQTKKKRRYVGLIFKGFIIHQIQGIVVLKKID